MRILHTGDWHLGHTLRDHPRTAEHQVFLDWLVETVAAREVDVLLLAGDVFDAANPPATAWRQWFGFLGAAKRVRPSLQVVVIAGNHDSPSRLSAPQELVAGLGVHVVGAVRRDADGVVVADDLLVPLRGATGDIEAWCVALPFLRLVDVVDLAAPEPDVDPVIAGMRVLHTEVFATARSRRRPGQPLIAVAHGYLVGGALSELSERKVLGGNQHALPVDLFPDDCAYVALGHLHRPQPVAGRDHVRYCGSPLPLSMPERLHPHHVVFADLVDGRLAKVWSLRTPRPVELLRVPEQGELPPAAALAAIDALPPRDPAVAEDLRPFVEVAVRLDAPAPNLAEQIAQRLQDKAPRLVRIELLHTGTAAAMAGGEGGPSLDRLDAEQVFVRRYQRDHQGEPAPELLAAFRELFELAQHPEDA